MSDSVLKVADAVTEGSVDTAKEISFLAKLTEPSEHHRQLLLDVLIQAFSSNAMAVFLDPSADSYRLALQTVDGTSELGILPKPAGRTIVETLQREATLHVTGENQYSGKFYDGILRVDQKGTERRVRVHLIPTANGMSATLRAIPSLPADTG